ncbi:hypothetical protein A7X96_010100 [Streptomyces sp. ST1020]
MSNASRAGAWITRALPFPSGRGNGGTAGAGTGTAEAPGAVG